MNSSSTQQEVLKLLGRLNIWKRGDQRAPHKPLLVLYALARALRGEPRLIPFKSVQRDLGKLLKEFGPPRRSYHPEYPFWGLQADGLWEVLSGNHLESRKGGTDPKKSELLKHRVVGGFPAKFYDAFRYEPDLVRAAGQHLLSGHFPESLHEDIVNAVGLPPLDTSGKIRPRGSEFRASVIRAYQHRCAICGYDVRLAGADLGIEAAHIKWYQLGGPDVIQNGLCLCVLHHRLFDRGALGVSTGRVVLVSEEVHGSTGTEEWLFRFEGKPLSKPQRRDYRPSREFLAWHLNEVFKAPLRAR